MYEQTPFRKKRETCFINGISKREKAQKFPHAHSGSWKIKKKSHLLAAVCSQTLKEETWSLHFFACSLCAEIRGIARGRTHMPI